MADWDQLLKQAEGTAKKILEKADGFPAEATATKALMARQAAALIDFVDGEGASPAAVKAVLDSSMAQLHAVTDLESRLIAIERHLKGPDLGDDPVQE